MVCKRFVNMMFAYLVPVNGWFTHSLWAIHCEPVPVGVFDEHKGCSQFSWYSGSYSLCVFVFVITNVEKMEWGEWFVLCSSLFNGSQEVHIGFVMQIILKNSLRTKRICTFRITQLRKTQVSAMRCALAWAWTYGR